MPLYNLALSETPPHTGVITLSLPPMTAFLWIFVLAALLIIALWLAAQRPLEYVLESHHHHEGDAPQHPHEPAKPMEAAAPVAVHAVSDVPVIAAPPVSDAAPVTPDDLKIIEGIGPKIAALLNQAGIQTFSQLAATPTARLDEILTTANLRRLADPGTWAQQAALAAANQWDALKRLQDSFKGGKPTH